MQERPASFKKTAFYSQENICWKIQIWIKQGWVLPVKTRARHSATRRNITRDINQAAQKMEKICFTLKTQTLIQFHWWKFHRLMELTTNDNSPINGNHDNAEEPPEEDEDAPRCRDHCRHLPIPWTKSRGCNIPANTTAFPDEGCQERGCRWWR